MLNCNDCSSFSILGEGLVSAIFMSDALNIGDLKVLLTGNVISLARILQLSVGEILNIKEG